MKERLLIITADDFGYCSERNCGIVECYQKNAITRTSLLVNGVAAEEASSLVKQHGVPVGLHMNLTEGHPTSTNCNSLVDSEKCMLGKMGFRKALSDGQVQKKDIKSEMEAQIQMFMELIGSKPKYVDGHQHIHVLPGVCDIFAEILHSYAIEETRLPKEPDIARCNWVEPPERLQFYMQICQDSELAQKSFDKYNIRYTDCFVGTSITGEDMTIQRAQSHVLEAFTLCETKDTDGIVTVEHMVHPGYPSKEGVGGCGVGPDQFSADSGRLKEMNILTDAEMLNFYKKNKITLTDTVL